MPELATYRERVIRGFRLQNRTFRLFADRIAVQLRWGRQAVDTDIPLTDFQPAPPVRGKTRLRVHRRALIAAIASLMLVCAVLLVQTQFAAGSPVHRAMNSVVVVLAVALAASLALVYRFKRPVDTAKFRDHQGKVILDILRAGPDAGQYEEFTAAVLKQIRKAGRA